MQQQQQQQALQHQQQQQLQASNAAQTLLANLPPNVNPRDYILALQQLQNQNIAAQLGGQIPNINLQNLAANLAGANSSAPTNQEEISTIFVVGFPDDMQVGFFLRLLLSLYT